MRGKKGRCGCKRKLIGLSQQKAMKKSLRKLRRRANIGGQDRGIQILPVENLVKSLT